ncbi:MAG: MFS transporter, partial [Candidatus Helarchaeales archaeon]
MVDKKWLVLSITTIGSFMSSLDGSIMNIAIPSISADLNASFEVLQWIPIIYLLVMAVSLVSFGRLADLKGKKQFFLLGVLIFTISSLFSAFAVSGEFLVLFRGIQGIGSSLISANAVSMVTEAFPPQERGKALGINVASIYLGLVLGPVLGGILVNFLTWRSIFFINLPIGIIVVIVGYFKLEQSKNIRKGETFDVIGMISFGSFLAFLLLALTLSRTLTWTSPTIIIFIIVSISCLVVFIHVENKVKHPMLNLRLFRENRLFAAGNSAAVLNYVATMGASFLLSIFLQSILGIPAMLAGLLLAPTTLTMALMSPISGRISDAIGTRVLCTIGMSLMAFGFLSFILTISINPIIGIVMSELLLGTGIGLFSSPNQSAVMGSVTKKDLGIAAGTLQTMRVTGQSISVGLLSFVLGIFLPPALLNPILSKQNIAVTPEISMLFILGMQAAFLVSMMICIA